MLPTMTLPSVAPPPPRGNEPANGQAADSEGGDAFAQALQRAQREPTGAHRGEGRAQATKSGDASARSTRHAQAKHRAPEHAQPAEENGHAEPATVTSATGDEQSPRDTASGVLVTTDEATTQLASPMVGLEPATVRFAASVVDAMVTPANEVMSRVELAVTARVLG